MAKTKIEWTQRPGTIGETWNPTTGCDKVSQGCKNCYAEAMHARLQKMNPKKYDHPFLSHVKTHPDTLGIPLSWSKPRTVFVNSMSDLFHPENKLGFIDEVFGVMAYAKQHTFIIATKRPEIALEWSKIHTLTDAQQIQDHARIHAAGELQPYESFKIQWPLPNVWFLTSVEDQKTADERIPYLLQIPAVVRGISAEPLLGPIDISQYLLDWVICGGESGHNARPMRPDWARSLRDPLSTDLLLSAGTTLRNG